MYWGITTPLYGISYFLPSIIKDLGYKSSTAQLLTVPIYITAANVAIASAWLSDRRKQRSPFIFFFMSLIAIGFIIVLASTGRGVPGVVYFGVFIAVVGKFLAHQQRTRLTRQGSILRSQETSPGSASTWPATTSVQPEWPSISGWVIWRVVSILMR